MSYNWHLLLRQGPSKPKARSGPRALLMQLRRKEIRAGGFPRPTTWGPTSRRRRTTVDGGASAGRSSLPRRSWESTASRLMEDCTLFIRAVDVGPLGVLTHVACLTIDGFASRVRKSQAHLALCSSRANCALAALTPKAGARSI